MRRAATAASALLLLLLTGCAQSVDPIERLGRKAAEKMSPGCAGRPLAGPRAERPPSGRSPGAPELRAEPTRPVKRCPKESPPTASPRAPR